MSVDRLLACSRRWTEAVERELVFSLSLKVIQRVYKYFEEHVEE